MNITKRYVQPESFLSSKKYGRSEHCLTNLLVNYSVNGVPIFFFIIYFYFLSSHFFLFIVSPIG